MTYTVANQKIFHINRDMPKQNEGNFILVKKENLERALVDLEQFGTLLFLYLVGNKDGYDLAFSPQDVINRKYMARTSVDKYVKVMKQKGYLVEKAGNVYDFFEVPQKKKESGDKESGSPRELNILRGENNNSRREQVNPQDNKEIYNKDNINISKSIKTISTKDGFVF